MIRFVLFAGIVGVYLAHSIPNYQLTEPMIPEGEKEPQHWNDLAEAELKSRLNVKNNENVAKNVILFIGDGMGMASVTAGRILRGQVNGRPGEEYFMNFEKFPNSAMSKTYNVDRQTPDSAGTGTAIMSGVKANFYQVGLNAKVLTGDCETSLKNRVTTILDWALAANMKAGIVTTARITHATPAAAYAHSPDRYWEGDTATKDVVDKGCKDIARQLVEDNANISVIFGGGRRTFMLKNQLDPETNQTDGHREDGRDLIKMWEDEKKDRGATYKYVWNKEEFDKIDPKFTDYALGLFEPGHMQYDIDRDKQKEPSLAEMTSKAIKMLQRNSQGFFLLVEGARIDHGHHDSLPIKALYDVLALEDAIQVAIDLTKEDETLTVVTADHSTPMVFQGYQYRGSDLFGFVEPIDPTELPMDHKPYTVLIYANGPRNVTPREHLSLKDLHDKSFTYPSAVPLPWTTHAAEDVGIYAKGPMAHLFNGVLEQNYIGHVMAYAACIGRYYGNCPRSDAYYSSSGSVKLGPGVCLLGFLLLLVLALRRRAE